MARVTDPICTHARKGTVSSHAKGAYTDGPHAATNVCDRTACIEDAKFWVRATSGMEPHHVPDGGVR